MNNIIKIGDGIYQTSKRLEPIEGVLTIQDLIDIYKEIYNKHKKK